MPKTKGTDIVCLKAVFKKEGKNIETVFLSKLSQGDREVYERIIATSWTDVDIITRIFEAAAETLFPSKQDALVKLGQTLSERAYSGIYSAFLLIPKPSYVFKRAANVWQSYYDRGSAIVENETESSADFVVRGFPELPKALRDAVCGHIAVLLGKTGLKNINIKQDDSNPEAWVWRTKWG